ncbi:TPA: hypothetical protein I9069_001190 [Clostridium perfringens]|nr:hypothetical protein [Clostridium perfringens]
MNINELLVYDSYYRCYTANSCRKTGLPMFGGAEFSKAEYYEKYVDIYLSKTRCKKIKRPVLSNENPVAFFRVQHGYVPLYLRE